jgi:hypothetical protein
MTPPNTTEQKLDQWLDEFVTERKLWMATVVCTLIFLVVGTIERALLQFVVMAVIIFVYRRFIGFGPKKSIAGSDSEVKK